jgi:hypothetical protein
MKVTIEKQSNRIGEEYLHHDLVTVDVGVYKNKVFFETDEGLYLIPIEVFIGVLDPQQK